MCSQGFEGYLNEARRAAASANGEYAESVLKGDIMKLRDASEKAWLATLKATDALLEAHGLGPGETYRDRRSKLWKLKGSEKAVEELGLYDRFQARMMSLHLQGFYDGDITPEQFKDEMEKVLRYITDVEALARQAPQKPQ